MLISEPRNTEFFECDCHSPEDLIRAEYSEYVHEFTDGTSQRDRDLNITFQTRLADYDTYRLDVNFMLRFWSKLVWRIRNSVKILVSGEITTSGYFIPCRSFVDSKNNTVENTFGYDTTKNLAKWLDTKADKIKEDHS